MFGSPGTATGDKVVVKSGVVTGDKSMPAVLEAIAILVGTPLWTKCPIAAGTPYAGVGESDGHSGAINS